MTAKSSLAVVLLAGALSAQGPAGDDRAYRVIRADDLSAPLPVLRMTGWSFG